MINMLKTMLSRMKSSNSKSPMPGRIQPQSDMVIPSGMLFRDSNFCAVASLSMHISLEVREKNHRRGVDIWSLIPIDHLTFCKEKGDDKKLKVAKTFRNWLQAFSIMAGVICRHQLEKASLANKTFFFGRTIKVLLCYCAVHCLF